MNETSLKIRHLEDFSSYWWKIWCPILFVTGLAGNTLSLVVLQRMKFWKKPALLLLVLLCLTDMTVLCTGLSRYWVIYTFDIDLRLLSDAGCKIHLFMIYFFMHFSSWILVCFCFERFLKTNFPFRYKLMVSIKRELVIVGIICLILVLVDGHFFWTNGLTENATDCESISNSTHYFDDYVFTYIDFTFLSLVPAFLMLFMNTFIARVLRGSLKFVNSVASGQRGTKSYRKFSTKTTRMLLLTSTYFLCTTMPISVYFIVDSYINAPNKLQKAQMESAMSLIYIFQYTNYSINIFLYTTANIQFRNHLKKMLRCRMTIRTKRRITKYAQENVGYIKDETKTDKKRVTCILINVVNDELASTPTSYM